MRETPELFRSERPPFRLERLEVYNWGPFSGLHAAAFDARGTAIVGATGSGKTTLVDAFVTLLTEQPKYNLASTGGHESDRDLVSYVRGVIGAGNDSGDGTHISRKGKTTTGLCSTYTNGEETVRLGGLLWLDGTSTANSDLKRAWIFSRHADHSLEQWLSLHHEGGLRLLKQSVNESGEEARVYHTSSGGKRAFLARVRSYFEVGENAFNLLNRAAGLKQLNSIDQIFRELVLDDQSQFNRAAEVADDFNRLTEIHEELLIAKRQLATLHPVESLNRSRANAMEELERVEDLRRLLPVWMAEHGHRLWGTRVGALENEEREKAAAIEALEKKSATLADERDTCHEAYLRTGGSSIEDLEKLIGEKREKQQRLEKNRRDYQQVCATLGLDAPTGAAAFAGQKASLDGIHATCRAEAERAETKADELGARRQSAGNAHESLLKEYGEAKALPESNLPSAYPRFRAELAKALGLDVGDLPFVAELIQVKDAEHPWRGAIERALGGNRFRILVPPEQLRQAVRWVNEQTEHRLHIRLYEATSPSEPARFMEDGFTRKLNFKDHPLREALKHFLARHDLHCVESPDLLTATPHALTREGMISGRRGYFEKKDQKALDEDWCTGFDNRDRLRQLEAGLATAKSELDQAREAHAEARKIQKELFGRLQLVERLQSLEFSEIDTEAVGAELQQLESRLRGLLDPESDTAKAHDAYLAAKKRHGAVVAKIDEAKAAKARTDYEMENARKKRDEARARLGEGLTVRESALTREHLALPPGIEAGQLDRFEREQEQSLGKRRDQLLDQVREMEVQLTAAMKDAQTADTGALAEVGTGLDDIPAYLDRRRVLVEEDLPAKQGRFLDYLNQSSDHGVTQLLQSISGAVDRIRQRIEELNRSLESVDFKEGRYLRLVAQDVSHESLRTLERSRKTLRAAQIQNDEDQGERHYKALQEVVRQIREAAEKKHTVGARALLDPRYRVEFHAVEIDRASGGIKEKFKGSQGGSGGEKEIIASYILTASLSYALSPDGGAFPLHATIVLDEAFSKSSRPVANRIIQALGKFSLHPIFVTPNKEMRLLRNHTQSLIYVHRKEDRATLTSISWEALEKRIARAGGPAASAPVPGHENP